MEKSACLVDEKENATSQAILLMYYYNSQPFLLPCFIHPVKEKFDLRKFGFERFAPFMHAVIVYHSN